MKEGDTESQNSSELENCEGNQAAKFAASEDDQASFCISIGRPIRRSTFCHVLPNEEFNNTNRPKSTTEDIDLESDYQEPEEPIETDSRRTANVPPVRLRSCLKSTQQSFGDQKLLEFGTTDFSPRMQNNSRDNSFGQRGTYMTYFVSEALLSPGPCIGALKNKIPQMEEGQNSLASELGPNTKTDEEIYTLPDVGSGYKVTFSSHVEEICEEGTRRCLNNLSLSPHKKSPKVSQNLKNALDYLTGSAHEVDKRIKVENYSELLENSVSNFVNEMQFSDKDKFEEDYQLNQKLDLEYATNPTFFNAEPNSSESILENLELTENNLSQSKQSVDGLLDELNVLNERLLAQTPASLIKLDPETDTEEDAQGNADFDFVDDEDDQDEYLSDHREPAEKGDACYVHNIGEIEDDSLEKFRVELLQTPATYSPQEMYLRRDILARMRRPGQHQYNDIQAMINNTCPAVEPSEPGSDEDTGLNFHGIPVSPLHPDFRDSVVSTMKSVRAVREIIVKDLNKLKELMKSSPLPPAQESEDLTLAAAELETAENQAQEMDSRVAYVDQIELELREIDSCYKWVSSELLKGSEKESDEESDKHEGQEVLLQVPRDSNDSGKSKNPPLDQLLSDQQLTGDEFFERRKELLVKCKNVHDTLSQLSFYAESNSTVELNIVEVPEIDKSALVDPTLSCSNSQAALTTSDQSSEFPSARRHQARLGEQNDMVEQGRRQSCTDGYGKTSRIPVLKTSNLVKKSSKKKSFVLTPGHPRETPMFLEFDVEDQSSADERVENRPHYRQPNMLVGDSGVTRMVSEMLEDDFNNSQQASLEKARTCLNEPIRKTYKLYETILDNEETEDEETIMSEKKVKLDRDEGECFLDVEMSVAGSYLDNTYLDFNCKNDKRWRKNKIASQKPHEDKYMHTSAIYTPVTMRSKWRERTIRAMINNEGDEAVDEESLKPNSDVHSYHEVEDEVCDMDAPQESPENQIYPALVKTPGMSRLIRLKRWLADLVHPCVRLYKSITDTD